MKVLHRGLSLAEGSKMLRQRKWRLLLKALFAEEGWNEVSERVEYSTIAADLEEVLVVHSKAMLSEYFVGVADNDKFAQRRSWSSSRYALW